MSGGYVGKLLWVNLTTEQIEAKSLDEDLARNYVGGSGIATKILWDETDASTEPLSPENPLIFMTGPLTGTLAPSSSRFAVSALSPLTGIWGEANSGGMWAGDLKRSGFDGIVVKGRANRPVFLWINGEEATLIDASHLWGRDTYETTDLIRKEFGEKTSVAAIGQAGERLVRIAGIMTDGRDGRAAARCGLGAVMGYKNLKAIAISGRGARQKVHDREQLKESVEKLYYSKITYSRETKQKIMTDMILAIWDSGRIPVKNWREGKFEGFRDKLVQNHEEGEPYYCEGCRTGCVDCYMTGEGRRAVLEALAPLGSQCLVSDMQAVERAFQLCQRFGVDCIGAGAVVSFAMEAFEKGLIDEKDTGGLDLTWGNAESMVELVRQVGMREGLGVLLGEGVRRAAESIGGLAPEFALHVKGLEFPCHDPRAQNSRALSYATLNIGAGHIGGMTSAAAQSAFPDLGIMRIETGLERRFSIEGTGALTAKLQDYGALVNCLGICYIAISYWWPYGKALQPSDCLEWINAATGFDMSMEEFVRSGERIFNLQRMLNVRKGISRKDDTLPPRFLTHRLPEGGLQGNLPPLGTMLSDYYSFRGWSEEGIPTAAKLAELGLGDWAGAPAR